MISNQASGRTHSCYSRKAIHRSGIAATELAIVLPLLFTFLLGCVDYGRMTFWAISISNANATGCYYGATHRLTSLNNDRWRQNIQQIVLEELEGNHGFDPDNLTCQVETEFDENQSRIITVQTNYAFRTIVNWPGLPHLVSLSETATFRQFR